VYPTKDADLARKGPTLQNISDRLERLEVLLSGLIESSRVTVGSTTGCGGSGGESQTHIHVQSGANVNAIGTANQHPSNQRPSKLTWELLLNDERAIRDANASNIEDPPQDVRHPPQIRSSFTPLQEGIIRDLAKLI
jgi:hypothetical protein